jgi:predicted translation initiation factor SUI1
MEGLPGALFVIDPTLEFNAVMEARRLAIPVIAMLDTDADPTDIDLEDLSKYMKGKLACGGTVKGNSIELQGNHRDRVKELLTMKGYSVDNIS